MNKDAKAFRVMKALSWLTQLGLSLVVPPLLCVFIALRLQEKYDLGPWVLLVALAVGLLTAVSTFISFARTTLREANSEHASEHEKEDEDEA